MNLDAVLNHLLLLGLTAITPVVLVLANKLIGALAAKLHLANLANYTTQVDGLITSALLAVEQDAANALAANGVVMSVQEKIDAAVKFVQAELAAASVPTPAPAHLAGKVKASQMKVAIRVAIVARDAAKSEAPAPVKAKK